VNARRDDWDRHWDDYAEAAAHNPAQEYRRRLALGLLSEGGLPSRVLDIGAGTGDLAAELLRAFPAAEVLGLDVSGSAVELAGRKVPGAVFLQRNLLEAESPEPAYRGWATHAVCSEVLEHVERPAELLANAVPYLAPGCLLVVTVPGGPMSAFDRHIGHRQHYTPAALRSLIEQAGLVVEHASGAGFPFFNLYRGVVVLRGERLSRDVVVNGAGSALPRATMRVFGLLFRFNLPKFRWGWQIVAAARLPRNTG
jgi:SAM-dependent methyltransferase